MPLAPPTSFRDLASASGAHITTLEAAEQVALAHCPHLPPPLAAMLQASRPPPLPHQLVTLPHGRVYSHQGTVIDAEGHLIMPLSRELQGPVRQRPTPHRLLARDHHLPDPLHLPGRTLVLACASAWKNYFHWMVDALPRLRGIETEAFDRVFTPCTHPFQRETLSLSGLRKDQIIPAEQHSHIQAEELIVPSLPPPGHIGSNGIRFLRKLTLPQDSSSSQDACGTRIFLGREDARSRRIANAAELYQALEARNFRILHCSGLSVREQAAHLSRARFVIAPHGAALTNLVFCRAGTTVIECFASDYIRPHYHDIAGILGLAYHAHWTPSGDPAAQAWEMDIAGILALVDRLLENGQGPLSRRPAMPSTER